MKLIKITYNVKFKPGAVILGKSTDFPHFWPEMKFQRSLEDLRCSEIIIKAIRYMQSTKKK